MIANRILWFRVVVVGLLLALGVGLWADTLVLSNGDRLSGVVLSESEGEVVFDSEILGELVVPRSLIAAIERAPESPQSAVSLEMGMETGQLTESPQTAATQEETGVLLKMIDFINPFKAWESKLSLGYSWFGGETSRHNWFILFEANRKFADSEWSLRGRWDYSSTRVDADTALKTEDRFQANMQYRRNWTKRWFAQSRTNYQKDIIRRIEHDFEQSIGIGWRMIDEARFRVTWTPSYTLRYRDLAGRDPGWHSRFSLFQDLYYEIHPRIILRQDASISFEPAETSRAESYFGANLENRITERLSADLRFEYRFQYLVGHGVDGHERKFLAAMGYRF
jgi:hypothetical protein